MNAIRIRRSLRRVFSIVAALALVAASMFDAYAQAPTPEIAVFVDKSQGTNGAIIVHDPTQPFAPYRRYIVPADSGYPESLEFIGKSLIGYTLNGKVTAVSIGSMELVTPPGPSRAQAMSLASIKSTTVRVPNDADAFAVTCDGKFALVVGFSDAGTPVALVDLTAATQVAKLPYANQLARDAATGDDGSTGLVVLDNATSSNASTIARLIIGPGGTLSDSGGRLPFGSSDYVLKVRVAPGSHTGVALVNSSTGGRARLVSFAVPGLASSGSVTLAGRFGNAIAFDGTGRKIYARSGAQASVPDVIEVFDFDPTTGTLGQAASLTIGNVSGFTGSGFDNPMDVTADGQLIIAAEEDARGELPAPRITSFNATTGAIASTFSYAGIGGVQTVATIAPCSLPPTAAVDLDQHGLTGSWFKQATSGQGVEVEVFPNPATGTGSTFVSWFTYDTASGGADHQRWYTAQGAVVTGQPSAALTIYQNTGGNFNGPPVTTAQPVGTATLSFDTCTSGQLQYNFSDGTGRSGTMPLTRLTQNVTCATTMPYPTNADFALSGNWFGGAATSGQGFTAEVNPMNGAFFAAWYTYMPNGTLAGAAGQRWYTAQGAFTAGMRSIPVTIYETTGGIFDTPTPPGQKTVPVGTGTMAFQSCTAATFNYTFTGGTSAGLSSTINLIRVGPVPPGCTS
jgi:hypothetical protein